jgi:polysaccharide transporter, PST family
MQQYWTLLRKKFGVLQGSDNLRKIIANTGWLFADRLLRMGIGLFVGIWVARYLGAAQFGRFNYALAFVALFGTISQLGLPSLAIRIITHEPDQKEQILGTIFLLQLFGGILSLILSVGTIALLRHDDTLTMRLVAVLASASIFQSFDTIDLWFQSQVKSKYTVLAKNTAFAVVALGKVVLVNIHAPLLMFAGANLAESFIGAIGLVILYRWQGYSLKRWRWNSLLASTLLRESWPLILAGLSVMIYMKIDQIMLGHMLGDTAVGVYSAATRVSEVWYFVPVAIASSVAPTIYAAKKEADNSGYYNYISQLLRLLSCISILIAIPMTYASGPIIRLIFGDGYAGAEMILSIHIWTSLFVFTGVGTSCWFIAEGLAHLSFQRTLIGAGVNIFLNLILIPAYGGVGAAIATVVSQAFASLLSNAFHPKTRKIFQLQLKSFAPFHFPH